MDSQRDQSPFKNIENSFDSNRDEDEDEFSAPITRRDKGKQREHLLIPRDWDHDQAPIPNLPIPANARNGVFSTPPANTFASSQFHMTATMPVIPSRKRSAVMMEESGENGENLFELYSFKKKKFGEYDAFLHMGQSISQLSTIGDVKQNAEVAEHSEESGFALLMAEVLVDNRVLITNRTQSPSPQSSSSIGDNITDAAGSQDGPGDDPGSVDGPDIHECHWVEDQLLPFATVTNGDLKIYLEPDVSANGFSTLPTGSGNTTSTFNSSLLNEEDCNRRYGVTDAQSDESSFGIKFGAKHLKSKQRSLGTVPRFVAPSDVFDPLTWNNRRLERGFDEELHSSSMRGHAELPEEHTIQPTEPCTSTMDLPCNKEADRSSAFILIPSTSNVSGMSKATEEQLGQQPENTPSSRNFKFPYTQEVGDHIKGLIAAKDSTAARKFIPKDQDIWRVTGVIEVAEAVKEYRLTLAKQKKPRPRRELHVCQFKGWLVDGAWVYTDKPCFMYQGYDKGFSTHDIAVRHLREDHYGILRADDEKRVGKEDQGGATVEAKEASDALVTDEKGNEGVKPNGDENENEQGEAESEP